MTTPSREDMEMREKWLGRLRARVMDIPIDVRAVLGRKKMPLEEFLKMSDGNVIIVDRYISDPVDIEVQQDTRFKGKMGIYKGNKAIRIEESIN
jgi:flagellar motor switch protein FliM